MHFGPLNALLAAGLGGEPGHLWQDAKLIVRYAVCLATRLERHHVLGIRLDHWLHLVVAAALFLIAARLMSRRRAALLTLFVMLVKELIDIPAKLQWVRAGQPLKVSMDTGWDVALGLVGLGAGLFVASRLGDRWRAPSAEDRAGSLEPLGRAVLPVSACRIALGVLFGLSLAVFIRFAAAHVVEGDALLLLPHGLAVGLLILGVVALGPANTLLLLLPVLPFANWLQDNTVGARLNVGTTLILTLLCCEIVRRLKQADRGLAFQSSDWPLVIYAPYACLIVLINCALLGAEVTRARWLIPPTTGLAVYFLAKDLLGDDRLMRRALVCLAASFAVTALVGIVEFRVRPYRPSVWPGAFFGAAPHFSVYLSLLWPLTVALALSSRARPRALYCLAAAAGVVPIALVRNRSCWVAAAVALVVLVAALLFRRDWVLGIGAAVTVAVVAGLAVASVNTIGVRQKEGKVKLRSALARRAATLFEPRVYTRNRGANRQAADRIIGRAPVLGSTGAKAHTLDQYWVITYGVPGALLAAAAVLCILAAGWWRAWRAPDPLVFTLTAGATACVLAAVVQGLGWPDLVGSSMQPMLWYVLGLAAASRYVRWTGPMPVRSVVRGETPAHPRGQPGRRTPAIDSYRLVLLGILLACAAVIAVLLWLMFGT